MSHDGWGAEGARRPQHCTRTHAHTRHAVTRLGTGHDACRICCAVMQLPVMMPSDDRIIMIPAATHRLSCSGKPDGPGRYVWANGSEYNGEWKGGRMHGQGTFVWTSGQRYDGEWKVRRCRRVCVYAPPPAHWAALASVRTGPGSERGPGWAPTNTTLLLRKAGLISPYV